jgi:hypothetical protein
MHGPSKPLRRCFSTSWYVRRGDALGGNSLLYSRLAKLCRMAGLVTALVPTPAAPVPAVVASKS